MYTLFTDKSENFECNIDIEGASISDSSARLVLETKDVSLLFEGTISSDGKCQITIPKLKDYSKQFQSGLMKLEVIAEDTFFSPWEDSFEIKASKKVQVEVTSNQKDVIKEGKPSIKVSMPAKKKVQEQVKKDKPITEHHGAVIAKILNKRGITVENILESTDDVQILLEKYYQAYEVNIPYNKMLNEILNHLN